VAEWPSTSNFFAVLTTDKSRVDVAELYRSAGWEVRKSSSTDFEVRSPLAELVIEADPVLVHGLVVDPASNVYAITEPLRKGAVVYSCECYSADRSLLLERAYRPTGR
jgi:hypothetical protein